VEAKMHTGKFPGGKYAVISPVNVCLNSFAFLCIWFLCSNMPEKKSCEFEIADNEYVNPYSVLRVVLAVLGTEQYKSCSGNEK
jgi:hypothetical protein